MPCVPARLANGLINSTRNCACFLVLRFTSYYGAAPLLILMVPAVVKYRLSGDNLPDMMLVSLSKKFFFFLKLLVLSFFLRKVFSISIGPSINSLSTARLTIPPSSETNCRVSIGYIESL